MAVQRADCARARKALTLCMPSLQGIFICKLFHHKNIALLIRWYALLVLDLLFHILHGAARLRLELNCLAGRHIHKNLHTAMQTQDKVKRQLCLDVKICQGLSMLNPASTSYNL